MNIFKVAFLNQGQVFEIYAKTVRQGDLYGFVEVEDLVFGRHQGLVVDPAEERLKQEFAGVRRTLIPMHAVIRIDLVEKAGKNRIRALDAEAKVTPFPGPIYTPES
jgi:hypothetical protein